MILLMRYWRETLIIILAAWCIGLFVAHERRVEQRGVAKEKTRVADSVIKVVTPQLARVDTLVVRDTVRVRVAVNRVTALHDTVLRHLTDTVLVKEFVTRADSAAKACTELSGDCAAFRAFATQKMAALQSKVDAAPAIVVKSCVAPGLVSGLVGLAVGYVAHR